MTGQNEPTVTADGAEDEYKDAEGDGAAATTPVGVAVPDKPAKKAAAKKAAAPKKTAPAPSTALAVRPPPPSGDDEEEHERRKRHNHPGTVARREVRRLQVGELAIKRLFQDAPAQRRMRQLWNQLFPNRKLLIEAAAVEIFLDTLQELLMCDLRRTVKCTVHRKKKKVSAYDFNFARALAEEDCY
jgi:histone H3/H4